MLRMLPHRWSWLRIQLSSAPPLPSGFTLLPVRHVRLLTSPYGVQAPSLRTLLLHPTCLAASLVLKFLPTLCALDRSLLALLRCRWHVDACDHARTCFDGQTVAVW